MLTFSRCYRRYPTSAIVAKFMFPKDQVVDYVYSHFMNVGGTPYARISKMQCRLSALLLTIPSTSQDLGKNESPETLSLPLDFVCRDRGKMVMLSDWSENALSFTFDARPDAFLIGHDTCSRGAFVLNAGGRNWGYCPEWKWFRKSSDYSTIMIDNRGQELKAPLVNLTTTETNGKTSFASSDLTYAYNWRWTENARQGQDFSKDGYEIETSDPRDFGFNAWWGPHKLHGEKDIAFVGLHIWRKRFNDMRKVTRSAMLVRDKTPFVLIADDVDKGDDSDHEYTWAMTTPGDVRLNSFDGEKAVLGEHGGSGARQLVIQNVSVGMSLSCHFREIERPDKAPGHMKTNQIRFSWHGQNARFRFLIYSIATNVTDASHFKYNWMEATSSDSSDNVLIIDSEESNESYSIAFTTQQATTNATKMSLLESKI